MRNLQESSWSTALGTFHAIEGTSPSPRETSSPDQLGSKACCGSYTEIGGSFDQLWTEAKKKVLGLPSYNQ